MEFELSKQKELGLSSVEIKKLESELEKARNKLVTLNSQKNKLNESDDSKGFNFQLSNASDKLTGIIKKVGKWTLAVFGIRSAYNAVRSAIGIISQYNEQVATDIEYIKYTLAMTLEPIIKGLISLVYALLSGLNQILNVMFGINLFSKNSAKSFANAKSSTDKMSKSLSSLDEITNIEDSNSSGGGSNGLPSFELGDFEKASKIFDFIKKKAEELIDILVNTDWQEVGKNAYNKLKEWFLKIDWGELYSTFYYGIGAAFGALGGTLVGFFKEAWKDVKKWFEDHIEEDKKFGGNIVTGILWGILDAFVQIGVWIYKNIFKPFIDGFKDAFGIHSSSKAMMEMGQYIIDDFKEGLLGIWQNTKYIFDNLKSNIMNVFSNIHDGVKNKVESLKSTFLNVLNSLATGVKNPLNNIIDSLNKMIKGINRVQFKLPNWLPSIGGSNFGLNVPNIPRLARGGVVNNPGKGVNIGGAITGERGAEMVVPLQNSQYADAFAQQIADKVDGGLTVDLLLELNRNILELANRPVELNINGTKFAQATYGSYQQEANRINSSIAIKIS